MDKDELLLNWARWNYGMRSWVQAQPKDSLMNQSVDDWMSACVAMSETRDIDCEKAHLKSLASYMLGRYCATTGSLEPPDISPDLKDEIRTVSKDCECLACLSKRELCKWKEWDVIEEDPVAKVGLIIAKLHNDPKLGFSPN